MMTVLIATLLATGLIAWTVSRHNAVQEPKAVPVKVEETHRRARR